MKPFANKDEYLIEKTVVRYFISVIKAHNYYLTFMQNFSSNGLLKMFTHGRPKKYDTPLGNCADFNQLAVALRNLSMHMRDQMRNKSDKYEYITMCINHLLHFYLEPRGVKMNDLCIMGEEIFDRVCTNLYGDTFKKNKPDDDIEKMGDPVQLKSKMFQDYVNGVHNGTIKVTFDKYLKTRKDEIDDWMERHMAAIHNDEEHGRLAIKKNSIDGAWDDFIGMPMSMPDRDIIERDDNEEYDGYEEIPDNDWIDEAEYDEVEADH